MRKFKNKLFNIVLEEIPNTGMSVLYSVSYEGVKSKDIVNAFFVHGSNLFIQLEGEPIKGMEYKSKYPIGTRVTILNQTVGTYYEKIGDSSALWTYVHPNGMKNFTSVDESLIGTMYEIIEEKPILFTTQDGVDIREGDKYYHVKVDSKNPIEISNLPYLISSKPDIAISGEKNLTFRERWHKDKKTFSSLEKAQRYILFNKKSLNINDVIEALARTKGGCNITIDDIEEGLINYLKSKK